MFTFTTPNPGMDLDNTATALVVADIQNDFLTASGAYYPMIEDSLKAHNVADHIEELLASAKSSRIPVFHSPHYVYPSEAAQWVAPPGAIGQEFGARAVVQRKDPVDLEDFADSGADYPRRFRKYLQDGETVNTSPHKLFSCLHNDLVMQLRLRRIDKVIMAGPVGNLCLEAHMRVLIDHGFEIAMVRDAVAGSRNEEGDAYQAAMVNWRFLANALWTTGETVRRMAELTSP